MRCHDSVCKSQPLNIFWWYVSKHFEMNTKIFWNDSRVEKLKSVLYYRMEVQQPSWRRAGAMETVKYTVKCNCFDTFGSAWSRKIRCVDTELIFTVFQYEQVTESDGWEVNTGFIISLEAPATKTLANQNARELELIRAAVSASQAQIKLSTSNVTQLEQLHNFSESSAGSGRILFCQRCTLVLL